MKIVVATDSFKGSLSSLEAGRAIRDGIKKVVSNNNAANSKITASNNAAKNKNATNNNAASDTSKVEVIVRPLADGGEGTTEALALGMGGKLQNVEVNGPTGKPVTAQYGIVEETNTAILEMSQASGITLVPESELNPLEATTFGVGQMIKDAIAHGARKFIVGIGGSATNDGGVGMLSALGFDFYDKEGRHIDLGGKGLSQMHSISDENVLPEIKQCEFLIACDVNNPLCGDNGASAIYGPQKGATPQMVKDLDRWLAQYAELTQKLYPDADPNQEGAGAAGGLGFAFSAFLGGKLAPGIDIVLNETKLEDFIKDADIVITGEGYLDAQTAMGKAPMGVATLAKKHNKTVLAFAGCVSKDAEILREKGFDDFFAIMKKGQTKEEAMRPEVARQNMIDRMSSVFGQGKYQL